MQSLALWNRSLVSFFGRKGLLSADEAVSVEVGRERARLKLEAAAMTLQVGTPKAGLTVGLTLWVCGRAGGWTGGGCACERPSLVPNSKRDRIQYCGGWVVETGLPKFQPGFFY